MCCISSCIHLISRKCLCVCVRDTRTRFLLHRRQTCCGCCGHRGSGYSRVGVARLVVRRELSVHFRFFLCGDCHFLIIIPNDFQFLPDLIRCRSTVEFNPIIILLHCSSNMVTEGIRGQVLDAVARRRQASLLVYYTCLRTWRYMLL